MFPYIPHTDEDRKRMLGALGLTKMEQLFSTIPPELIYKGSLPIEEGLSEEEVIRYITHLAQKNRVKTSFLGMGSYDRIIPSAVTELAANPAFVTAYTPYQPEISQGLLQAIFEFQSMICSLTGLDVANASLYDGHSAACEAASLMLSSKRRSSVVLVSETVHPFTLSVLQTWMMGTDYSLMVIKERDKVSDVEAIINKLDSSVAGVIVQSPNRYGYIEDYTNLAKKVDENKCYLTISSDPLSLVLQHSAKEWGADIAIGDTQPLGLASAFGGPSCGYMAVSETLMRKLPGRVVGQTVDVEGKRGFTLTLQAREQHIKRSRASSNICSNQALAALTTTIHISLVGYEGMMEAATLSYDKAHYLHNGLSQLDSLRVDETTPFWCEFPLTFETKEVMERVIATLDKKGIAAGVRLGELSQKAIDESTLVVAVTEKRTKAELDLYIESVQEALV